MSMKQQLLCHLLRNTGHSAHSIALRQLTASSDFLSHSTNENATKADAPPPSRAHTSFPRPTDVARSAPAMAPTTDRSSCCFSLAKHFLYRWSLDGELRLESLEFRRERQVC